LKVDMGEKCLGLCGERGLNSEQREGNNYFF
jgi:hypothetical protein